MVLLISFLAMQAQELTDSHINKVDSKGRRQGFWKVYDGDGNLKFTGEFHDGRPMGEFRYFYPNGRLKAVVINQDSGRIARTTNYYVNGNVMATGKYLDQKKDSTWLYFTEEESAPASEEIYRSGIKDGIWKIFYPDGKTAEEITYLNDKKEGPWVQYFTDGTVKMKTTYIADKLEGMYVVYHLNGKVEVSGSYLHDTKHGTWVHLTDIEELERREEYEHGKLVHQEIFDVK
jgi:antitoxin component YwqK of YwqJK toxin-antitoxin module